MMCPPFPLLVFLLVGHLVSLLVDVSKRGLGNASLLSNLFVVYGGLILVFQPHENEMEVVSETDRRRRSTFC